MHDVMLDEMGRVPVETWLHVIPQLIARIDVKAPLVQKLVKKLLVDVGKVRAEVVLRRRPRARCCLAPRCTRKRSSTR